MYASNRCAFQRLQYVTSNNIDKWDSFRALNEKQIRSNNIKHIFNALWSLCLFVSTGAELGQCLTQFSGRQASSNSIPLLSVQTCLKLDQRHICAENAEKVSGNFGRQRLGPACSNGFAMTTAPLLETSEADAHVFSLLHTTQDEI